MSSRRTVRLCSSLTAALIALGLSSGASLAATGGPTTLSGTYQGTIVDWPAGKTGTVRLGTLGAADLADGTVDADGHFSLALPDPKSFAKTNISELFVHASNYWSDGQPCVGQGTASPLTAHRREFELSATIGGREPIVLKLKSDTHLPYPVGQGYSDLTYYDVATTLNGTVSCPGYHVTFKGTFPAGWSLPSGVVTDIDAAGEYAELTTPDPLPASVTWHLYNSYVGIGIQFDLTRDGSPGFLVETVYPETPAARAGLLAGDRVVEVDGRSVTALTLDGFKALQRGEENTPVVFGVRRGGGSEMQTIRVVRAQIQMP